MHISRSCGFLASRVHWTVPVVAGVLLAFTLLFLFRTSFSDPGILPRASGDEALFNDRGADSECKYYI